MDDEKAVLVRYLQHGRDALLWKLEGLGERDVRRTLVPTGTNLLGLVKHVAITSVGYLGDVFDRPFPETHWVYEQDDPLVDMWCSAEESRADVLGLWERAWEHSDETIRTLPLDARGRVPWWPPERADVTLHQVLVHVAVEIHRHAGHADILREQIDGAAGLVPANDNVPDVDWPAHVARVNDAAEQAARREG